MFVLAAEVWHFWIAVLLFPVGIGMVLALVIGYVRKVVQPKYPRR